MKMVISTNKSNLMLCRCRAYLDPRNFNLHNTSLDHIFDLSGNFCLFYIFNSCFIVENIMNAGKLEKKVQHKYRDRKHLKMINRLFAMI